MGCAYSPEGEELKCMFWEAVFRETPKLKTGRWASYRAKTCKGIQVRASGWELGTPDRSLGYSEQAWNLEEFPEIQECGQLKIWP